MVVVYSETVKINPPPHPPSGTTTHDLKEDFKTFRVDDDGNVGIGTTNPLTKLHVVGDVAISSNLAVDTNTLFVDSVGNKVGIGNTNPSQILDVGSSLSNPFICRDLSGSLHDQDKRDSVSFGRIDESSFLGMKCRVDTHTALGYGDNANQTKIGFFTWGNNYNSSEEVMSILGNGNVGIGTTTPGTALDVVGTVTATGQVKGATVVGTHYGTISGSNAAAVSSLTATGSVGIGTASPGGKLEISADFDHTLVRPQDDQNHYLVLEKTGNKVYGTGPGISFVGSYSTSQPYPTNYAVIKGVSDLTSGEGRYGRLEFYTNSHASTAADKLGMVINHAGNVGIGVAGPIAKLDVTYTEGVLADFSYSNTSTWHNKGIRATGGTGGFIYGHDINHSIFMRTSPKSTGDHNAYISPAAHKFYTGALMGLAGLDIRANINNTGLQVTGTITATSSITPNSDDRIKYNEEDVLNPLTLINQLNPQKYEKIIDTIDKEGTWIPTDEEWESVKSEYTYVDEFGFIAQDVRKIPELAFLVIGEETTDVLHTISSQIHSNLTTEEQMTYTPSYLYKSNIITQEEYSNLTPEEQKECIAEYKTYINTQTPLSLNYNGLFVVAVGAIKELKAKNDALETQLASILTRLDALEGA